MLSAKRLVLAGVAASGDVGHVIARRALLDGAHVTLVAPPGLLVRCRELAEALPRPAHVVLADLTQEEDAAALREHLRCAYGTVDGALLAVTRAPAAGAAARTFAGLARAIRPLLPAGRGSLVAVAPPAARARPSALEEAARALARDLAPAGARVNVVAARPGGERAAADAACLLLGPLARGVTGQVVHAGGPAAGGRADRSGPPRTDRRTSDRPAARPPQAVARRMPAAGRTPHTAPMPSVSPAATATTDQEGTSR